MTTEAKGKPMPRPDELTQPFWDAAKEHRLAMQKCKSCGYFNYPPKPICDKCGSEEMAYETVSGRGTIYSFTVMHQKNVPGFETEIPYVNVLVELEEQPRLFMITNLRGAGPKEVKVGMPVEAVFEKINDDITLPQFKVRE